MRWRCCWCCGGGHGSDDDNGERGLMPAEEPSVPEDPREDISLWTMQDDDGTVNPLSMEPEREFERQRYESTMRAKQWIKMKRTGCMEPVTRPKALPAAMLGPEQHESQGDNSMIVSVRVRDWDDELLLSSTASYRATPTASPGGTPIVRGGGHSPALRIESHPPHERALLVSHTMLPPAQATPRTRMLNKTMAAVTPRTKPLKPAETPPSTTTATPRRRLSIAFPLRKGIGGGGSAEVVPCDDPLLSRGHTAPGPHMSPKRFVRGKWQYS